MELVTRHQVYYSNHNEIPIREIAESLVALEEIIKRSPKVLEELFPGIKFTEVKVYVDEIKAGSLREHVVVRFFFGSQEKMDVVIDNLREKLGMEKIVGNTNVLIVIIAAIILTGGYALVDKAQEPERAQNIENSIINVVNIGAESLGMESSDLRAVIEKAIDKQMAVAAAKVINPARSDDAAEVQFSMPDRDAAPITMSSEIVRSIPRAPAEQKAEEQIQDFDSLEITLVATDLENSKKGWAVRVPSLSSRRVKLHLDPNINPDDLFGRRMFHGAATVIFSDRNGEQEPSIVFLREILD